MGKLFFAGSLSTVIFKSDFLASADFRGIGEKGFFSAPGNPGIGGGSSGTKLIPTSYWPGWAPSPGFDVVNVNFPFSSVIPEATIPGPTGEKPTESLGTGLPL